MSCAKLSFTKMFWLVNGYMIFDETWDFSIIANIYEQAYLHVWPTRLANSTAPMSIHDACVQLWPRNLASSTLGNALDLPSLYGKIKEHFEIVGIYHEKFDIFFISYNEPNAEENYNKLLGRFPNAKRVHGIKGINNAHRACAVQSATEMFWTVDGDTEVDDTWNFDYFPGRPDSDYIHVWYSRNPVNDLEYGYGAVKLWPKNIVLAYHGSWVDYTTSVGGIKIVEEVVATTKFNSSPFEAWKSAYRECLKLMRNLDINLNDVESQTRLDCWINNTSTAQHAKWCELGSKDAIEWYQTNPNKFDIINDFGMLKRQFSKKYQCTLTS